MTTQVFPFVDPAETQSLSFDFAPDLGTETLSAGTMTSGIALLAGADATPSGVLNGAPVISGSKVLQSVKPVGRAGNDYYAWAQATTSGGRVLRVAGILPVRTA